MHIYFIQKEGSYGHGVFWIGSDVEEGKTRTDELAAGDEDSHHDWVMYEYQVQTNPTMDAQHVEICRTKKRRDFAPCFCADK